jgi:hypothetical protein
MNLAMPDVTPATGQHPWAWGSRRRSDQGGVVSPGCKAQAVSAEAIVAIVAVVVAVVSAYFAFVQARSAKSSAEAATEQAASSQQQALAAREGVSAAREQVAAAHRQAELQEQMWRDQAQPYVVADVQPDQGHGQLLRVVLENRGSTIARNIHVVFDPPLQVKRNSSNDGPFTALDGGVSYLPPGRVMTWTLGVSFSYFEGKDERVPDREVTVTCDGPLGPVEPLRYTLSFEALRHQAAVAPGTLFEVQKAVKEIAKVLKAGKP